MSAPSSSKPRLPRRTVTVLGKPYQARAYHPQFALGIMCQSEPEQIRLHRRLSRILPGREVKVLVI